VRRYHRWKCRAQYHARRLWFWMENGWHRNPKAALRQFSLPEEWDIPFAEVAKAARCEAAVRNAAEVRERLGLPPLPRDEAV